MRAETTRVIEPKGPSGGPFGKLKEIYRYRELLTNMIRKELKVRYKNSALGFFWSMLNPAMYLVIFTIVFTKFLGTSIPYFPIYLLSGLLAWNLFSASLNGAAGSIVGNASLVTKVYFPREILPLGAIGASLVHFFLQFLVLLGGLLVFRYPLPPWSAVALVPVALIVEVVFIVGLSLMIASLNVYFRDVQHFLELALLAWFWMTPIVYPISTVASRRGQSILWNIYMANPITSIVMAFQRGIYGNVMNEPISWYLGNLGKVAAAAVVLCVAGFAIFNRFESRLAEEL